MEVLPFAFARAYKRSSLPARVLFNLCAASADLRSRVPTCRRRRAASPMTFHPLSTSDARD